MRVLITGAAGYLGRRLCHELAPDFELTLADIVEPPDVPAGATWRRCDITDEQEVRDLVTGHDAIVHTVAIVRGRDGVPISSFLAVTVGGTWNVVDAAANAEVPRIVNISSIVAGGQAPDGVEPPYGTEFTGALYPGDIRYGISKRVGETIADSYAASYPGLSVVNLRPVMIAGDGQNPEPQPRDGHWFVHVDVDDLARAVRRALETDPAPSGTYTVTAARDDSIYSWTEAQRDLGFVAEQNWSEIP
jgi:UDP-glucose 4-epimerase